jgi:hypothetical protein
MRQQQIDAAREYTGGPVGDLAMVHVDDRQTLARAVPLLDETVHVGLKRHTQGLKESGAGGVIAAAKGEAEGEFGAARQIDFTGERDVPV